MRDCVLEMWFNVKPWHSVHSLVPAEYILALELLFQIQTAHTKLSQVNGTLMCRTITAQ